MLTDRQLADALWLTLEEIGEADSLGGAEYQHKLLGKEDAYPDKGVDDEGPNSKVKRYANAALKFLELVAEAGKS
jgi:hypothetical protein